MVILDWQRIAEILVTMLVGLAGGSLSVLIKAWFDRPKTAAEAKKADAEAGEAEKSGEAQLLASASDFVGQLVGRVSALEKSDTAKSETITLLLKNDKEKQARIKTLEITSVQQRDMIDGQQTYIEQLRAELERYKRIVMNLFKWIRKQGLEPPSPEELDSEWHSPRMPAIPRRNRHGLRVPGGGVTGWDARTNRAIHRPN